MICKKRKTGLIPMLVTVPGSLPRSLYRRIGCFFLLVAFLGCAVTVYGKNDPGIEAKLSKTVFPLDSTATLTITVSGSRSANIDIPEVENLIFHRRGQSTQVQVINGAYSSSITSNFVIQATKAGKFTIPALKVNVEGSILQTRPITFEVTANGAAPGQPGNSASSDLDEVAFVRIIGIKKRAYTGEVIPVEIKGYFQGGLRVEIHNLPTLKGNGFVMSPPDEEASQTTEAYKGRNYSVISWKTVISPIKEGIFDLDIDLNAALLIPQRNRRSRFNDPFFDDDFFSGFFGGYQRKNVTLTTQKQSIDILPLPEEGKPDNFNGPIGEFDFEVKADPTNIEVGDPITLTMKITGKGNFDRVTAPTFPNGDNWKTYSPSSEFINSGKNYEGEKVFEQAIVAKNNKIDKIPPLTFSYFNPKTNSYISKSSEPVKLTFKRARSQQNPTQQAVITPPAPLVSEQQQNTTRLPLAAIRLQPGSFAPEIKPVFNRTWFIIAIICGSLVLLLVLYITQRQRYLQKNSVLLEKKRVSRMVAAKLTELQQAINDNNDKDFLGGCREIIQAQLGLSWQVEPSAITPIDLQKRLPSHSPLKHIFAAAEQYAYGGGSLTVDQMKDYIHLLKTELEEMS